MKPLHPGSIVILDCGGQYAHLIANRVRRLGAFSEIRVAETPASDLTGAAGIILSGGPQSVYEEGSPQPDKKIFNLHVPVLGLCYGHQWIAHALGGEVKPGTVKEYGRTEIEVTEAGKKNAFFHDVPPFSVVWMSHGDEVNVLPEGFTATAKSATCGVAAMADDKRKIFGAQFHLEVTHSEYGMKMLGNFMKLCKHAPWSVGTFEERIGKEVKKDVGEKTVFMLVSGGVDSTVAFTLLNKVLGADRVQGLLVDTGLMRKDEVALIHQAFQKLGVKNLRVEDASEEFFSALEGVFDPEKKRRAIGDTFLAVQKRVSEEMNLRVEDGWMLGQGTIYPDTIETGGTKHSDHIKTHHNRVPAIQAMIDKGFVIEPLKELYKDEVRQLGMELGLPKELVSRHPFPGPGLGVRILCAASPIPSEPDADAKERIQTMFAGRTYAELPVRSVGVQGDGRTYRHAVAVFSRHPCKVTPDELALATDVPNRIGTYNRVLLCTSHNTPPTFAFSPGFIDRARADLLREADAVVHEEVRQAGLYDAIWQFPVVLLPFGIVAGSQSIVLRPISSTDAMTADAYPIPEEVLQRITDRLVALPGISVVFLDLTNKPPGTIEWE